MIEGFINEEQGGLRAGKGYVDQIFTLKQLGEKVREEECRVIGFIGKLFGKC